MSLGPQRLSLRVLKVTHKMQWLCEIVDADKTGDYSFNLEVDNARSILVGAGIAFQCCDTHPTCVVRQFLRMEKFNRLRIRSLWLGSSSYYSSRLYLTSGFYYPNRIMLINTSSDGTDSFITVPSESTGSNFNGSKGDTGEVISSVSLTIGGYYPNSVPTFSVGGVLKKLEMPQNHDFYFSSNVVVSIYFSCSCIISYSVA
ncbi:uncharacterized protein RJT21DRAFT_137632 [Scheffersomyces amazonensis]|uniref:uncharacterized protein n=1 Tax=Scheffersomyces amazonensis TaxID=1078765 RepID=UPI00315C6A19